MKYKELEKEIAKEVESGARITWETLVLLNIASSLDSIAAIMRGKSDQRAAQIDGINEAVAVEFGFKGAERGENLERTIERYFEVRNGKAKTR